MERGARAPRGDAAPVSAIHVRQRPSAGSTTSHWNEILVGRLDDVRSMWLKPRSTDTEPPFTSRRVLRVRWVRAKGHARLLESARDADGDRGRFRPLAHRETDFESRRHRPRAGARDRQAFNRQFEAAAENAGAGT